MPPEFLSVCLNFCSSGKAENTDPRTNYSGVEKLTRSSLNRKFACKIPIFAGKKAPVLKPLLNWTGSLDPCTNDAVKYATACGHLKRPLSKRPLFPNQEEYQTRPHACTGATNRTHHTHGNEECNATCATQENRRFLQIHPFS